MPFKYRDPVDRLAAWSIVEDRPRDGLASPCWHWIGSRNNVGRPRISVRLPSRSRASWITVARFIVQFVHGEAWGRNHARRKVGAHDCDNADCANPDHVKRSTQKRNVRDCVARGRHDPWSGVNARLNT